MKKTNKVFFRITIFIVMLCIMLSGYGTVVRASIGEVNELSNEETSKIEELIEKQMKEGKIPGLSVTIVKEDQTVYQAGYGYSNLKEKEPVTSDTLFEIGSNSKAFTALGILKLQEEGFINVNDAITKYIPWLTFKYHGEEVQVTIEQFLHHTSGLPFSTIDGIPISDKDTAIEDTVAILAGRELAYDPGEQFEYATINYDVLGLLIEKVSGLSYEEYISKYILEPIGLKQTYLIKNDTVEARLAQGYKVFFSKPKVYHAPSYRGNTPAGYIMSCGDDMAIWMKAQLDTLDDQGFSQELIRKSHEPNTSINALPDGSSYADGWFVYDYDGTEISHSGVNPNYYSYIVLRPEDHMGVAVLSNTNSGLTEVIGQVICRILRNKEYKIQGTEFNVKVDQIAMIIVIISCLLIVWMLISNYRMIHKVIHKIALPRQKGHRKRIRMILSVLLFSILCYLISVAPYYFYQGVSWRFAFVWLPGSVKVACILLYISITLVFLRRIEANIWTTRVQNEKNKQE